MNSRIVALGVAIALFVGCGSSEPGLGGRLATLVAGQEDAAPFTPVLPTYLPKGMVVDDAIIRMEDDEISITLHGEESKEHDIQYRPIIFIQESEVRDLLPYDPALGPGPEVDFVEISGQGVAVIYANESGQDPSVEFYGKEGNVSVYVLALWKPDEGEPLSGLTSDMENEAIKIMESMLDDESA